MGEVTEFFHVFKIKRLSNRHRKAFERFLSELDEETCRNYSHFGYQLTCPSSIAAKVLNDVADHMTDGYVALKDSDVVGFGHLDRFEKKEKRHVVKLGIVIAPGHRGKGVGRKLMEAIIDRARQAGVKKIWLATYANNTRALRLYRSLGFVTEGVFRKEELVGRQYRDVVSMAIFLDGRTKRRTRANVGRSLTQSRLRNRLRDRS